MDAFWGSIDTAAVALLWPLSIWIALSGLDDLAVDLVALAVAVRARFRRSRPSRRQLFAARQRPIAILVPLWKEDQVIGRMVLQNASSIRYQNYHFFIGGYPNDDATVREVRKLEARFPHVHLAVCPHDGPTSKADCLNWIYQRIVEYEGIHGLRFEIAITHDAEDVIHSDSLHWINWYSDEYAMVQVPVLPLPTPVSQWVHGLYIDEFTEYQTRDMQAREAMGAFVPSNGVGTGFRRDALEAIARADQNRIFEPACLTEDYENGLRLRLHGLRQAFLPLHAEGMATREYFPHTMATAIRQRTRWVTGIALQTWDRRGWPGGPIQWYWLWRDRKGLIGNPASLLTNLLFLYGLGRWIFAGVVLDVPIMEAAALFGAYRALFRIAAVWRVFGWALAITSPLRILIGNVINSAATLFALKRFLTAKWNRRPLVWVKTEHAYPCQAALATRSWRLGEVLVSNGYMSHEELDAALGSRPAHVRLGEHLISCGLIDEDSLYEALSLQQGLPHTRVAANQVRKSVARALPKGLAEKHKLVPLKVDLGRLLVGGPELPTHAMREELSKYTALEVEFCLMTPGNYQELVSALLRA